MSKLSEFEFLKKFLEIQNWISRKVSNKMSCNFQDTEVIGEIIGWFDIELPMSTMKWWQANNLQGWYC